VILTAGGGGGGGFRTNKGGSSGGGGGGGGGGGVQFRIPIQLCENCTPNFSGAATFVSLGGGSGCESGAESASIAHCYGTLDVGGADFIKLVGLFKSAINTCPTLSLSGGGGGGGGTAGCAFDYRISYGFSFRTIIYSSQEVLAATKYIETEIPANQYFITEVENDRFSRPKLNCSFPLCAFINRHISYLNDYGSMEIMKSVLNDVTIVIYPAGGQVSDMNVSCDSTYAEEKTLTVSAEAERSYKGMIVFSLFLLIFALLSAVMWLCNDQIVEDDSVR